MRYLVILLVIFSSQLFASSNSSFGIGYRRDRVVTQPQSTSGMWKISVKDHDVNSVVESYNLEIAIKHFQFALNLDYGILTTGKRTTESFVTGLPPITFTAKMDSGYEVDVFPKLGYSFNLSKTKPSPYHFIPSVGYGFSRLALRTKMQNPFNRPFGGVTRQAFLFDSAAFRYQWLGPFLEGQLDFFFYPHWRLNFAYQFHFLQGRTKQPVFLLMNNLPGDIFASETILYGRFKTENLWAYKQLAEVSLSYLPTRTSAFRLQGIFSHLISKNTKQTIMIKNQTFVTGSGAPLFVSTEDGKIKQKWIHYSLILYADYLF